MSVDKIIELREAAMAGSHDPITVKDLVKVRLPEDYWQNLIDHGVFFGNARNDKIENCCLDKR